MEDRTPTEDEVPPSLGKALFLDRDGTLIEHVPYLHDPDQVRLVPGAAECLKEALASGFMLFLFTNQSGVGRGFFGMEAVEACNQRLFALLDLPQSAFSGICIAPESPGETGGYRKPNPRFILEMIDRFSLDPNHCWMIGDSDCDSETARWAKIHHQRLGPVLSLREAIRSILKSEKRTGEGFKKQMD